MVSTPSPVAPPLPSYVLEREIDSLRADHFLLAVGPFDVFATPAGRIPHSLREIGRLRERTFRSVGEGTGRTLDLDRYDTHHEHLFTWHREARQIAAGSRLAATEPTLARRGVDGLYTHSLFCLDSTLFDRLGPALEVGRTFVRARYQRDNSSLLALWRGIAAVLARDGARRVFGAVSISQAFHPASRDLIVAFLSCALDPNLATWVRPRKPYRGGPVEPPPDLDDLCARVAALEGGAREVPVLVRQYFKLGARVLGFNVDPAFANVVDALMLLDLDQTESPLVRRLLRSRSSRVAA